MRLSSAERELIAAHRANDTARKVRVKRIMQALSLAHRYEAWLQRNFRGSTFSTFVNEFGYDAHDASEVFSIVEHLRAEAIAKVRQVFEGGSGS